MPNVFADGDRISGFIDLGKAGKADRWQDLAICYISLKHNFEGRYNGGFPYPGYHPDMLFENSFLLSARLVFEKLSKISQRSPLFAAEYCQEKETSNET